MAIENQRVRWADIEVEQNENDVEQTVHDIIRSMSQGSTQTKADGESCKGLSRWVNLEAEGETSRVPEVEGGSCKGLSRWVNLETKGIAPAPPLRFNRINIKNMDNDSTRSVVYNSLRDSLGWLRMQIKTKFKIPIDQQRITLYKTVLEGDGRLLSACNLHDESLVHVSDMRKLQVHVKTLTHGTLHMTVPPSLEVSVFMQRVGCLVTLHPFQMWLTYSVHTMLSTNRLQDVKH